MRKHNGLKKLILAVVFLFICANITGANELLVHVKEVSFLEKPIEAARICKDILSTLNGIKLVESNPEYTIHVNAHAILTRATREVAVIACSIVITAEYQNFFERLLKEHIPETVMSRHERENSVYRLSKILDNRMFIASPDRLEEQCRTALEEINTEVFGQERYLRSLRRIDRP